MNRPFPRFLIRWLVSSLGLWIAAGLFGSIDYNERLGVIVIGGLVLAIINTILKPILIILSLPAILLSLGLFMLVINGLTIWIASRLYPPLHVKSFWAAILAGVIIGLVNYLVSTILAESTHNEPKEPKLKEK
jgi:putative membrane protein